MTGESPEDDHRQYPLAVYDNWSHEQGQVVVAEDMYKEEAKKGFHRSLAEKLAPESASPLFWSTLGKAHITQ